MKLFLDTNIVLDYVENRKPFVDDALALFQMSYDDIHQLYVSDLTFTNIAYIARKRMNLDQLYEIFEVLCAFLHITGIGGQAVRKAVQMKEKDFEDVLQYLSAKQAVADCIITRNKKDFYFSDIPVYTPEEFIHR